MTETEKAAWVAFHAERLRRFCRLVAITQALNDRGRLRLALLSVVSAYHDLVVLGAGDQARALVAGERGLPWRAR